MLPSDVKVFVPGVLACSGRIEKHELVAVSVAMERPDGEGGWFVGVTRGTTLSSEHAKSREIFLNHLLPHLLFWFKIRRWFFTGGGNGDACMHERS